MSENIVQVNEEAIKRELKDLARESVEETLNAFLDKEADKLANAARHERNMMRQGYRSGHCARKLTTASGEVTLKVPKFKGLAFQTAIMDRYRRRETSVEEGSAVLGGGFNSAHGGHHGAAVGQAECRLAQ